MSINNYHLQLKALLKSAFVPSGYSLTKGVELDPISESAKYEALAFSLNSKKITYRKGNLTADRPGAFLSVWKRPQAVGENQRTKDDNKPIPYSPEDLDYLFVKVEEHSAGSNDTCLTVKPRCGIFIFPVSVLIAKGIVVSEKSKGKTGFRVFPPWSADRGVSGTKVFSESGKKTQRWQLPYFFEFDGGDFTELDNLYKVFPLE